MNDETERHDLESRKELSIKLVLFRIDYFQQQRKHIEAR